MISVPSLCCKSKPDEKTIFLQATSQSRMQEVMQKKKNQQEREAIFYQGDRKKDDLHERFPG